MTRRGFLWLLAALAPVFLGASCPVAWQRALAGRYPGFPSAEPCAVGELPVGTAPVAGCGETEFH